MMSYSLIRQYARQAHRKAQRDHRTPMTFVGLGHDAIRERISSIPFLGKNRNDNPYAPKGWKRVDAPAPRLMCVEKGYLFVDSSGFGRSGEGALSAQEFVDYIYEHDEFGYGIVEAGQFQVVVATYQTVEQLHAVEVA